MSEFNKLVEAYLMGNNIYFKESEKELNTLILSDIEKKHGFIPELFKRLKPQKESLKIYILDGLEEKVELNYEADIVIWNDSFSGKYLEERIKEKIGQKNSEAINKSVGEIDPRYLGMGRDILYAKFSAKKRVKNLLEEGRVPVASTNVEKTLFSSDIMGEKRFVFIIEKIDETQYLKREFNRFLEFFCMEEGVTGQSLPIYLESINFWFGGMLHAQLTNRLNQDLKLFLSEDTVLYMLRLGYIIPFINEMDLFSREVYLNPQAPNIAHLFYLCGVRGMFVASSSWDSILFEDIREGIDFRKLKIEEEKEWIKIIAKPMGSRILKDEANAVLFGVESVEAKQVEMDDISRNIEQKLKTWIDNPDFPILKPGDRTVLMKQVAVKWMEKGTYCLELEEFRSLLFTFDILPEGKRTLAHVHEVTQAIMNSGILSQSNFNQIIPVSRLIGETIILWMLEEEYNIKKSLESWLDRPGFNQRFFRKLLKRFAADVKKNILTPLLSSTQDIINKGPGLSQMVLKNALELYIAINNSGFIKNIQPIIGQKLYDMNISHEIIKGLEFHRADMHNIVMQQSVFIKCEFRECNLSSSYFAGSTFLNCRFEGTDIRNADFSGSFFRGCILKDNKYEDLILIGCALEDCEMDLDISRLGGNRRMRIRIDGAAGIRGMNKEQKYDLPILIYLLQKGKRFYSRYGFKINADIEFHYFKNKLGGVSDEKFLNQYNYVDVFDEITMKPELFFAKPGSIHYIKKDGQKDYTGLMNQGIFIDHVIKYNEPTEDVTEASRTKILYHTDDDIFIEDNLDETQWFKSPLSISDRFVGHGISAIFLNPIKILTASIEGGLFLFEWIDGKWVNIGSKFHSEPVNKIFPDCFENMAFVKRGSSVIEIWDTLNNLSLVGRLVTSFKKIVGIRLIENLNHVIIYGEWVEGSIGALTYNIINKHLVTYWNLLSWEKLSKLSSKDFDDLEIIYLKEVEKLLTKLEKKASQQVSIEEGFIKRGWKKLRQIMDALEIIFPRTITYMEGEPVEFEWRIRSSDPVSFPINKSYIDIITGEKVDFEFEIKILDIQNVQSGKLRIEYIGGELSVLWKEDCLVIPKGTPWGDYKLTFGFSLLGERQEQEDILRIRPNNPFRGGKSLSKETGSDFLFVGRETELKTALELIENGASFIIKGARRIGKTSFMNRLRENLPGNVLAAYISFDEFEQGVEQSALLTRAQNGLSRLKEKYPEIYNEFIGDFGALRDAKPSLDFEWLLANGLEKLKKYYSHLLGDIWPDLEKDREPGKSLLPILKKLYQTLKNFEPPFKLVFIVDEIGIAKAKGAKLKDIFNPFRTIIEGSDIVIVLAGVPENFSELTIKADLITDSGLMSFLSKHIMLGPLTDEECKILIMNNLSQRIQIDDETLNYALQLSARRPEDLQIIMQHALDEAGSQISDPDKPGLCIENRHIETGLEQLLKTRGDTCFKIWEKITERGRMYLRDKFNGKSQGSRDLLESTVDVKDMENISREDIDILKGYGFTGTDEKLLIIPVYFREWVRLEFFKQKFEKEDEKHED